MCKFAFLILNYNTPIETEKCVRSIESLDIRDDEVQIVIVDNDSHDESIDIFQKIYKEKKYIHIIENTSNEGFSRGNNMGYKYICDEITPDFIVMLNSDIECRQKNFLQNIKRIYDEKNFLVLGPDVYAFHKKIHQSPISSRIPDLKQQKKELKSYLDMLEKCYEKKKQGKKYVSRFNKKVIEEVVYKYGKRFHLERLKKGTLLYNKAYENVVLHGSALIFSREYMNKYMHALYPEPFYYGEEDLLYLKCNRNGDKIVYDPDIKVWHAEGVSARKTKGKKYTVQREIFQYENYISSKKMLIDVWNKKDFFNEDLRNRY